MVRQRWAVRGGVVLGLLVLTAAGQADEAAAVKSVEELGGKVTGCRSGSMRLTIIYDSIRVMAAVRCSAMRRLNGRLTESARRPISSIASRSASA